MTAMRQNSRKISASAKRTSKPKQKPKPKGKKPNFDVYIHNAGPAIPPDAVLADVAQQVPINSYSGQPSFYVDRDFTCVDCGRQETWTAQQQKWYYEVAKGSLYGTSIRCRACRAKHRAKNSGHGDPNPIKHLGTILKRIRFSIEPALLDAGFKRERTRRISEFLPAPLEYSRSGLVLRCGIEFTYSSRKLLVETMDDQAECRTITKVPLQRELTKSIDKTVSAILGLLERRKESSKE